MIDALHPCLLALLPVLHPQPKTSPAKVVLMCCEEAYPLDMMYCTSAQQDD